MRHGNSRLRLPQKPAHAWQLQRNLVTSLVLYESIRTTRKRAKVVQPMFDKLITLSKTKEAFNAIREINTIVTDKNASKKIMEVLSKRFSKRSSGYTRLVPAGARKGDGAQLVDLTVLDRELSPAPEAPAKKEKTRSTSSGQAPKAEAKPAAAKKPAAKKKDSSSSVSSDSSDSSVSSAS
jgi:large subunit ribosomal protein L17